LNIADLKHERPWLLKHMIAATPMEAGLATSEHAEQAFRRLESDEFNGQWGMYLNPETLRVNMVLPNSLMAAAEAQYGRMDEALTYCYKIAGTIAHRMPGAYSDISPDRGCFIQAWASYGIIWPVVHSFLGFRPDAANQRAHFVPQLPGSWHTAHLQDVRVGSARMNLAVDKTEHDLHIALETSDPAYEITLGCACPVGREPCSVTLNGTPASFTLAVADEHSLEYGHLGWCLLRIPPTSGLQRYELCVSW
jgi:hypothetical protein